MDAGIHRRRPTSDLRRWRLPLGVALTRTRQRAVTSQITDLLCMYTSTVAHITVTLGQDPPVIATVPKSIVGRASPSRMD